MAVFVLDKKKNPLMPCSEKRARLLLERGHAVVHCIYPFVIRLKNRIGSRLQRMRIKIDPGSKTTGLAVVFKKKENKQNVVWLAEVDHHGQIIKDRLMQRRGFRRRRRSQNLRYRKPRFSNRLRSTGWLPPSLRHRVESTLSWINRLRGYMPINALSVETAKFDTTLACHACNQKKANLPISEFLKKSPKRLQGILQKTTVSLKDTVAVNATRNALYASLLNTNLPIECATGGQTKWNRMRLNIPKTHALDAACVGQMDMLNNWDKPTLSIRSMGRGSYKRTRLTSSGFPRGYLPNVKTVYGFQTGDLIKASIPCGKKTGNYCGRVAIRSSGNFNIQTQNGTIQGISCRFCKRLQRADGYNYNLKPKQQKEQRFLPDLKDGEETLSI